MVYVLVVQLFVFFAVAFEVDPFVALFLHVGDEIFNSVSLSVINSRHQISVGHRGIAYYRLVFSGGCFKNSFSWSGMGLFKLTVFISLVYSFSKRFMFVGVMMGEKASLVFVDTNIVIELYNDSSLLSRFDSFLCDSGKSVLVTDILCYELSQKDEVLDDYADILIGLPHTLAIPNDWVLKYEIKSYPKKLNRAILYEETRDIDEVIRGLFSFSVWDKSRDQYESDRRAMFEQVEKFKSGQWENPWQVAMLWILNDIMKIDYDLFSNIRESKKLVHVKAFPSEWVRAHIAYEKYIIQGRETSLTDLGDFLHTSYIPYCGLVIVENQLCDILNKIKRESGYNQLADIDFRNLRYLRGLNIP